LTVGIAPSLQTNEYTAKHAEFQVKRQKVPFFHIGRAHVSVDIAGCRPDEALRKVKDALTLRLSMEQNTLSKQPLASMH
jgi:hypothetical protein